MLLFLPLFWTILYDRSVYSHTNSYNNAVTQCHIDGSQGAWPATCGQICIIFSSDQYRTEAHFFKFLWLNYSFSCYSYFTHRSEAKTYRLWFGRRNSSNTIIAVITLTVNFCFFLFFANSKCPALCRLKCYNFIANMSSSAFALKVISSVVFCPKRCVQTLDVCLFLCLPWRRQKILPFAF